MGWNELARAKLSPLMSEASTIEVGFLLGLNIVLVRNTIATYHVWNNDFPYIYMSIDEQTNIDHASLCEILTTTEISNNRSVKVLPFMSISAKGLAILENNVETHQFQKFVDDGNLNHLTLNEPLRSKLVHTTMTSKLSARIGRVGTPIELAEITARNNHVSKLVETNMSSGKLLAVLSKSGWSFGIILKDVTDEIYLVTQNVLQEPTILLVDLGCRIMQPRSEHARLKIDAVSAPLNITTLNYLRNTTTSQPYSTSIANIDTENVLVYSYDNRSHDKYDEALIMKDKDVTWLGDPLSEEQLKLLQESYDKKYRFTYSKGKFVWQFDSANYGEKWLLTAYAIDRNCKYYTNVGMAIEGTPNNFDLMDVNRFMSAEIPETLIDGMMLKLTEKEWKALLGVYGSAFEEMASKTFTQQDDLFVAKVIKKIVSIPERGCWDDIASQSYVYTTKTMFFSAKVKMWFARPSKGGDAFMQEEKISLGNSQDWWKKFGNEEVLLKELKPNPLSDVMIDNTVYMNSYNWSNNANFASSTGETCNDEELNFDINLDTAEGIFEEIVPHDIQDMWINTDLSMDLRQYVPQNVGNVRSKENPDKITSTMKVTVNAEHPMESRPVLTKWTFEEHRSITGRLFSKIKYRNPQLTKPKNKQVREFIELYFDNTFTPYTRNEQLLDVDPFETMLWISKRRDGLKIAQELNDLLTHELGLVPLNAINIHLKLESLMKESPIMHWGQHQARAIYWQRKAIAAISSPVFLKIKSRLKNSLKSKYVYADGLTPGELNQKARNTTDVQWFFENDLSKQDRQTDKPLIDVEMEIYLLLGASPSMINWWRTMHQNWKFRARWNKGYAQEMRLTGQSTTALGNLITNMQVHLEFLKKNDSKVKLVFFLGDDILVMLNNKPDVSWLDKFTKKAHNMKSTQRLSDVSGLFCCMIAYKNPYGGAELGPDYVRLRYRFEVTNGVGEASPENIENRCQSYACMLGNTKEMQQIRRQKGWTIPLEDWYDAINLIPAIQDRYELDEYTVLNNYNVLCTRISKPVVHEVQFRTYTNVKVY
jgi:hypothetical protein